MPGDEASDEACAATVTRLINEAGAGDPRAAATLLPLVYDRLRELARRRMRGERPDQTLQATALVHEAYLRLVDRDAVQHWDGRWHFFTAAAEAMRRILVELARGRARMKRGGGRKRLDLDPAELTVDQPPDELVALDEALAGLAVQYPELAELVKLRYFAGLTIEEASRALGIIRATAGPPRSISTSGDAAVKSQKMGAARGNYGCACKVSRWGPIYSSDFCVAPIEAG